MPRVHRPVRKRSKRLPLKAIRKANRKRSASTLERLIYQWLEEEKIPFHREHPVGRCHVDIFIEPRTAVELNGCYWHGCNVCNRKLTVNQLRKQKKDGNRYGFFRKRGLDVVVIWECEVEREPERVRAMLKMLAKKDR
jgi:G:T-mismatch repair DNA endonuclease (very short patch repair protein)